MGQFPATRALSYLNLAIHNAIVQARSEQLDSEGAAAGAAAVVLAQLFPKDEQATTARLQRESLYEAMARQAGTSRVYGGIHYPMDLDEGYAIARKVADRALQIGVAPDRPFAALGR